MVFRRNIRYKDDKSPTADVWAAFREAFQRKELSAIKRTNKALSAKQSFYSAGRFGSKRSFY